MRFLIVSILFFTYVYADLQSKITASAQEACFLKNIANGLNASDYTPIVTGQTLIQTIESTHTSIQSSATCDSWIADPYVNVDTELYQVIANMDCSVNSEQLTNNGTTTTYYWTQINQYSLSIDCQTACEVPRDIDGNMYDFTPYINEPDCSITNLQQLVLAEDPNSLYIIQDAQYLNCSANTNLTGCFYKKILNFDGNTTDNNTTDTNSSLNNADLTGTNQRLDAIGQKLDTNVQKVEALGTKLDDLGTKLDSNGQKVDNLGTKIDANGIKIDSVRDAITNTGNYLASELNSNGDKVKNEIQFQGDRLHADLEALNAKPTVPDINISNNFDDTGMIEAIHQNTDAINQIKDLNSGELDADASFLDTYQTYYNDITQSIQSVENNVNDLMATIQGNYTPQFGSYNSCVIYFSILNSSKTIDMCRYSSLLRPYFTFILTIAMLILLIRLHFYLFPKVFKSD